MKDKTARALAIVALVFMGLFVAALVATLADHTLFGGSIGFIALGCGVCALMIFVALKADGRGYSITQMNNEIEMQKLEKAAEEQKAAAEQKAKAESDEGDSPEDSGAPQTGEGDASGDATDGISDGTPETQRDVQSEGERHD